MTANVRRENRSLISAVLEKAAAIRGIGDAAADFIAILLARGNPEDLARYGAEDLATVALIAWDHLQERQPGRHKIRIANPDITVLSDYGWRTAITTIEIVNDNMPFLVDSVMGELQERGLAVHLALHPVLMVARETNGALAGTVYDAAGGGGEGFAAESFIHIHVERIERDTERTALAEALSLVLDDCRLAVADWKAMLARLEKAVAGYRAVPPPIPVDELAEAVHFLDWIAADNFTLLGMREYAFDGDGDNGGGFEQRIAETGLGILRDPDVKVLRRGREMVSFTPEIREFLEQPVPLIVTKANVRSRVHRRAHMDYIGVKLFDASGHLSGELRIVGLFTSTAYTASVRSIPLLRHKLDHVLRQSAFDKSGHSGKALANVIEQYPRDELFQIDLDTLTRFALAILQLDEHPRVRVLARPDKFDRFVSLLVFVPRERYSSDVRERIGAYLAETYEGRVSAFYPAFPEGALVRVHFIIGRYEGVTPKPAQAELENAVAAIARNWTDNVHMALVRGGDPQRAEPLLARYRDAFSVAYQEAFAAEDAVADIAIIETLSETRRVAIDFVPQSGTREASSRIRLKLFHLGEHMNLSSRVPVLENMGFCAMSERTYGISPAGMEKVWLHEMALETVDGAPAPLAELGDRLEECYIAVWKGIAEDDGYNGLVLRGGLDWGQVAILRAYSLYLRQAHVPFSQDYMWSTLNRHAAIAVDLVALFRIRLDPDRDLDAEARAEEEKMIAARIEEALGAVDSLDEDRIIRRFANLVTATLRTNVFQRDAHGAPKPTMAFKIRSQQVEELPEPRPFAEIFVYSPRVEGVHLRFGKVARGGLRWSDRRQDFRTEVLGLAKAQQVKNAVIVPVGAKGGFVPKRLPADGGRDDVMAEGIAAYKLFVSTLLDLTDNLDGSGTIPPARVVRHDADDPYLVVAADKGTASFSDIANQISQERHFWLDDAFASGGSAGYDHKKMGITARGAWEAVKRHFREMDRDIQSSPFTVIGVGDMSGDVFGNGMLLSRQIRLLAAFDHRDIFIDPDADPEAGFAERKRLFELPRSSWQDYDRAAISPGGGVFPRRDKAIVLTDAIRRLTGLDTERATPFELIRALLTAEADLLWFGGIGTYVCASDESEEEIGDRANDALRVRAREVRAKVVSEGANLGMTQRGRIEFARAGGRVNTDAIDNSAGVNSSDMEVNIKIALGGAVRADKLTLEERNKLLAGMTDEVAELVLRNNYLQTLALSLAERRGVTDLEFQIRFIRGLEAEGQLDRAIEALPDDAALAERAKQGAGLTRPELAVLLAYAKITLFDDLVASDVPDDAYLGRELMRYFPPELQDKFADEIHRHRLRREIIATVLANSMINRGGPTLVSRMVDETGADVARIAAAFAAVRDSFDLGGLNGAIDALDNRAAGEAQLALYGEVQELVLAQIKWFLRNVTFDEGLAAIVERYKGGIAALGEALDRVLPDEARERVERRREELEQQGIPAELAARIAALGVTAMAPDIVRVCEQTERPVAEVAKAYFALGAYFGTDRIIAAAGELELADYYDRLALGNTLERYSQAQRRLTAQLLAAGAGDGAELERWAGKRQSDISHTRRALHELAGDGTLTLSRLAVGASLLGDLVRS